MKNSQTEKAQRTTGALFFSSAVFLFAVLFLLVGFLSSSALLRQQGQESLALAGQRVMEKVLNHLDPALRQIEMNARYLNDGPRATLEQSLERFNLITLPQMRTYPQISLVYYGREDGFFFMNVRDQDSHFNTQVIVRKNDSPQARSKLAELQKMKVETPLDRAVFENQLLPILETRWWLRDLSGKVTSRENDRDYLYDPRLRPWYRSAADKKGFHWTTPYVFSSEGGVGAGGRPGITVSYPILESGRLLGVVGMDLQLEELSLFLKEVTVGKRGQAFVINSKGQFLAHRDEKGLVKALDGKNELRTLKEFEDPLFQDSYTSWLAQPEGASGVPYRFSSSNQTYWGLFSKLPDAYEQDWLVGAVVPEGDLLGELQETLAWSLLGAFAAFVLTFFVSLRFAPFFINSSAPLTPPSAVVPAGTGTISRVREITVLFYDIQGFSALTESLESQDVMKHLGSHLDIIQQVISQEGGASERYQGGAVMVSWNVQTSVSDHSLRAVRAAVKIQMLLHKMRKQGERLPPLKARMGLHTGKVLLGAVEIQNTPSLAMVGEVVSLARHLEVLGEFYGVQIIISEETYRQISDKVAARKLDKIAFAGRMGSVFIYEVMGLLGEVPETILGYCRDFNQAVDHYLCQRWAEAQTFLGRCLAVRSKDKPSQILTERCEQYTAAPPAPDWDGRYIHEKA